MLKKPFKKLKLDLMHSGKILALFLEDGEIIDYDDNLDNLNNKLKDSNIKYAILILPTYEKFHDDE